MNDNRIDYIKIRRFIELYLFENTHLGVLNLPCNFIEGIKVAMETYDFKKVFELDYNENWDDLYEFQKAYIEIGTDIFDYMLLDIMNFYYCEYNRSDYYLYQKKMKVTEDIRFNKLSNYTKEERLDMIKLIEGINQICYNLMPINYKGNNLHMLTRK